MDLITKKKRILLIENFASDFVKARLKYAEYLVRNDFEVYALIPERSGYKKLISKSNIIVLEYNFDRNNKGIFQLIKLVKAYREIVKKYKINIVHSYRFQPNLVNSLVHFGNDYLSVLHITGLGLSFSNNTPKYKFYKYLSQAIFIFKHFFADKIIYQNPDDIKDVWATKIFPRKCYLIKGSGIDTNYFDSKKFDRKRIRSIFNISEDAKVFICVTRLIWEKGIFELVEAFQTLKMNYPRLVLFIVGSPDYDNPRHVDDQYISNVNTDSDIIFLGKRDDIPELLSMSDVFILPSYYREGIPRSILEALSMGLPIITTDMPGCNLTVLQNENGILIKPRSKVEIAQAVELIINCNLNQFALKSRKLALEIFQDIKIYEQIIILYK